MGKPCQQLRKVIASFINFNESPSDIRTFPSLTEKHQDVYSDDVIIILEGKIELYNKKNHLLLGEISGPYILNIIQSVINQSYTVSENSRFSYMSYSRSSFYEHIEAQNLWHDMFIILSYATEQLGERLEVMESRSLYDIVKYYLIKIDSHDDLKRNANICNYITSRTGYSKSGVMTILKELKKGGYIETSNGRLEWIRSLPLRF